MDVCKYVVLVHVDEVAHEVYLKISLENSEFPRVSFLIISRSYSCSYWTSVFFPKILVKSHQTMNLERALGQVRNQNPAKFQGYASIWFWAICFHFEFPFLPM